MGGRVVTLPHGLFAGGQYRRQAQLRALRGEDEAYLLDSRDALSVAARVSELLARCLVRADATVGPESALALTVGDREALLLNLRASVFGDRLPCLLDCPACKAPMDVDLDVGTLLVPRYRRPRDRYERSFGTNGTRCTVRFRLPTGEDQELAVAAAGVEAGVQLVLERCVDSVHAHGRDLAALPDEVVPALSAAMAELDPQAELVVRLDCPECAAPVVANVDAATVLFAELAASETQLVAEVHALAVVYHWSETEILGLDLRRRRRYLDLVGTEPAGAR